MNEEKKAKDRRNYSKEFKEEVCKEVKKRIIPRADLCKKYEISTSLLSKWLRSKKEDGEEAFRGQGNRTAIEEENYQLKRENARLKMERDILKKATAYFAKDEL